MRTDHVDQQRDRGARPTIHRLHAESEASRRLAAIPGLGIITETAIAATLTKDLRHGAAGATLFPDQAALLFGKCLADVWAQVPETTHRPHVRHRRHAAFPPCYSGNNRERPVRSSLRRAPQTGRASCRERVCQYV